MSAPQEIRYANEFDTLTKAVEALPPVNSCREGVIQAARTAASRDYPDDGNVREGLLKLLSPPADHYWNDDLSVWFMALRNRKDAPVFILKQIVVGMADKIGLDQSHPMLRPLLMAGILGGVPLEQKFHSHHHTREVVCITAILSLLYNNLTPFADQPTRLAEILIAACIHDFAHDGMGNRRNNNHTPMRLETRSLQMAEPYLKAAGLLEESWQRIRVMVLATDVSKGDADDVSPAEWMRMAFSGTPMPKDCPESLRPLFGNAEIATQAALLEDADLGTSAGMPYEFARRMTALIAEETKVLPPTPDTLIGFVDHICRGTYITDAACKLFGNNLDDLRKKAAEENEDTIYYWS